MVVEEFLKMLLYRISANFGDMEISALLGDDKNMPN